MNLRNSLALALVGRDVVQATEDLEGRVALNAILLAEISLLSAVDLGELDVLLLQRRRSLLVFRGKSLAVTAPGGEDWNRQTVSTMESGIQDQIRRPTLSKDNVILLDISLKGVLLQLLNIRGSGNCRGGEQAKSDLVDVVHFCDVAVLERSLVSWVLSGQLALASGIDSINTRQTPI